MSNHSTIEPSQVNDLTLQKAAIYYSRFGRVYPLAPNSKLPLLPGSWTEYATDDPIQIINWWNQYPNANIALVMDKRLVAVDLDMKDGKNGFQSFNELNTTKSPVYQVTPSKGIHLLYRFPPTSQRDKPFYNATNQGTHGGIDMRSGNGYIVMSPSVINGETYALHGELDDLPELPDDLYQQLDEWSRADIIHIGVDQPRLIDGEERARLMDDKQNPLAKISGKARAFYNNGDLSGYNGDASAALMGLATLLYMNNLDDSQVLTLLANNQYAMNVAFKRKGGNYEAQVAWMWKYTCQKARTHMPLLKAQATFTPSTEGENPTPSPVSTAMTELQPQATPSQPVQEARLSDITSFADITERPNLSNYLRQISTQATLIDREAMLKELHAHMLKHKINLPLASLRQQIRQHQREHYSPGDSELVFPDMFSADVPMTNQNNFEAMLDHYGIKLAYNMMSHDYDISIPNQAWLSDTMSGNKRTFLRDLMHQHGLGIDRVDEFISAAAAAHAYHPISLMLENTVWDKKSRVREILDCLVVDEKQRKIADTLMTTWLCSAVMVLRNYRNRPPRGVVVLAGPQNCGKTSFFRKITPANCFGEGLHLDVNNKDSMKKSVKYWITELGEIDSTFRKSDIAALKSHISNILDELRLPYERTESRWPRRTVYSGTVNDTSFLHDLTGNTRFWTIGVQKIMLDAMDEILAGSGLAQFWKEVESLLDQGHGYILNDSQIIKLEKHNDAYRAISMEEESLVNAFDWDAGQSIYMTTQQVCQIANLPVPKGNSNLFPILKRMTGQPEGSVNRRVNGKMGRWWKMPPAHANVSFDDFAFLN